MTTLEQNIYTNMYANMYTYLGGDFFIFALRFEIKLFVQMHSRF